MSRVKLERFSTVELPLYNPRFQGGSAPSQAATVTLADGSVYDSSGAERARVALPYTLNYEGVALEDDAATLQTTLAALFGLRGKRAKLYRTLLDDADSIQWAWARLTRVPMPSGPSGQLTHIPLSFQFDILSTWRGHYHTEWTLNNGYFLNDGLYLNDGEFVETMSGASPYVITVTNGGNGICYEPLITITVGAAPITALTIATAGGTDIDWTGNIAIGDSLVIDCGAKSIKDDGVNAYVGFSYGGSHTANGWLELPPGDTAITISRTGGSTDSTVQVDFQDIWE